MLPNNAFKYAPGIPCRLDALNKFISKQPEDENPLFSGWRRPGIHLIRCTHIVVPILDLSILLRHEKNNRYCSFCATGSPGHHPPIMRFSSYVLYEISRLLSLTSLLAKVSLSLGKSGQMNTSTIILVIDEISWSQHFIDSGNYPVALIL